MESPHNYFVSWFCRSRRNIFNNFLLCFHKSIKVVKTFLHVFTLQAQPTVMMIQSLGCRKDCAPGEGLLHQKPHEWEPEHEHPQERMKWLKQAQACACTACTMIKAYHWLSEATEDIASRFPLI